MNRFKVCMAASAVIILMAAIVSTVTVQTSWAALGATLVRDVENGARDPVQSEVILNLANGSDFSPKNLLTVPAGKRLVIESITADADLPPNQRPRLSITTDAGGPTGEFRFVFTQQNLVDRVRMVAGEAVQIYADPGTTVRVFFGREGGTSNDGSCHFTISGHYVTL